MKFKIVYQQDNKINTLIIESSTYESLHNIDNLPPNILKIKKVQEFNFDLFRSNNHKKEVYELFTQLDIMLSAHLTFSQSIDLLLEEKQEKKIKLPYSLKNTKMK